MEENLPELKPLDPLQKGTPIVKPIAEVENPDLLRGFDQTLKVVQDRSYNDYAKILGDDFNPAAPVDQLDRQYNEEVARKDYQEKKRLSEEQGLVGEWWNSNNLLLWDVLLGQTISGVGWLTSGFDWEGNALTEFGNSISEWAREEFKIHEDPDAVAKWGSFRPWDHEWWAGNWPTIASFASLAIPATAATKVLGFAGKGLGLANKLTKTQKYFAKGVTQAIISRHGESMMESSQTFKEAKEKYLASGMSEEEANSLASDAAQSNYLANMPLLVLDIPQYLMLGRNKLINQEIFSKKMANAVSKGMFSESAAQKYADRFLTKGLIGDANRNYFLDQGKQILGESFEEGYQYMSSKAAIRRGDILAGLEVTEDFSNWISEGEFWTSAFFGGLGGGLMHAYSQSPTLDNLSTWMKNQTINKKDPQKSLTDRRIAEVQDRTVRLTKNLEALKEAYDKEDLDAIEDIEMNMAFDTVESAMKYGNYNIALEQLESLKSMTPEERKKYNIDEEFNKNIDKVIKKSKEASKLIQDYENKYDPRLSGALAKRHFNIDLLKERRTSKKKAISDILNDEKLTSLSPLSNRQLTLMVENDVLNNELLHLNAELAKNKEEVDKGALGINEKTLKVLENRIEYVKAKLENTTKELKEQSKKIINQNDIVYLDRKHLPSEITSLQEYESAEGIYSEFLGERDENLAFNVRYVDNDGESHTKLVEVKRSDYGDAMTYTDIVKAIEPVEQIRALRKNKFDSNMSEYLIDKYASEMEAMKEPGFFDKYHKNALELEAKRKESPIEKDAKSGKTPETKLTGKEIAALKQMSIKEIQDALAELEAKDKKSLTKADLRWIDVYKEELDRRKGKGSAEASNKPLSKKQRAAQAIKQDATKDDHNIPNNNNVDSSENKDFEPTEESAKGSNTLAYRSVNNIGWKSNNEPSARDLTDILEDPERDLINTEIEWEIDIEYLKANAPNNETFQKIIKFLEGGGKFPLSDSEVGDIPVRGKLLIPKSNMPIYTHMSAIGGNRASSMEQSVKDGIVSNKRKILMAHLGGKKLRSQITGKTDGYLNGTMDWTPLKYKINLNALEFLYGGVNSLYDENKKYAKDVQAKSTPGGWYIKIKTAAGRVFPLRVFSRTINDSEAELIYKLYIDVLSSEKGHDIYSKKISAEIRDFIKNHSDPSIKGLYPFLSNPKFNTYGELLRSMFYSIYNKDAEAVNRMFTTEVNGQLNILIDTKTGDQFQETLEGLSTSEGKSKFLEIIKRFPRQVKVEHLNMKDYKKFLYESDIFETNIHTDSEIRGRFFSQPLVSFSDLYEEGKGPKPIKKEAEKKSKDTSDKMPKDEAIKQLKETIGELSTVQDNILQDENNDPNDPDIKAKLDALQADIDALEQVLKEVTATKSKLVEDPFKRAEELLGITRDEETTVDRSLSWKELNELPVYSDKGVNVVSTIQSVEPVTPTTTQTSDDNTIIGGARYYNNFANKMVKIQEEVNSPVTQEEEEEIEAVIERAKELNWDANRLFRQLNLMGYTFDSSVNGEAFRIYLEDRLSGRTNIKVTSTYNFFDKLKEELATLESSQTTGSKLGTKITTANGGEIHQTGFGEPIFTDDEDVDIQFPTAGRIYINKKALKDVLVSKDGATVFNGAMHYVVFAKVGDAIIPFYQSSEGNSGKNPDQWYPMFGYTGSWIVKGDVEKSTGNMNYSKEIDRVAKIINDNLINEYGFENNKGLSGFTTKSGDFYDFGMPMELIGDFNEFLGVKLPSVRVEGRRANGKSYFYNTFNTVKDIENPTQETIETLRNAHSAWINEFIKLAEKSSQTTTQQLSPNDKIVWGHPTIGKSFLKEKGNNDFITLDDDYADEVNAFIDANRGSETRQEYKGRKPKEYNEFMLNLFDRLKVQAAKEGKRLFVSNTNILKERMSEFDKVITIPKDEFKKRFDARGSTYGFEDWKSDIDATVSKVDASKVISTTGYLSDLLPSSTTTQQTTVEDQNKSFKSPFRGVAVSKGDNKVNDKTIFNTFDEAVEAYYDWLMGTDYQDVNPEQREWIVNEINAGRIDNKNLLDYIPSAKNIDGTSNSSKYGFADVLADIVEGREPKFKPKPKPKGKKDSTKSKSTSKKTTAKGQKTPTSRATGGRQKAADRKKKRTVRTSKSYTAKKVRANVSKEPSSNKSRGLRSLALTKAFAGKKVTPINTDTKKAFTTSFPVVKFYTDDKGYPKVTLKKANGKTFDVNPMNVVEFKTGGKFASKFFSIWNRYKVDKPEKVVTKDASDKAIKKVTPSKANKKSGVILKRIEDIIAESEYFEISEDGQHYIDTRTGEEYKRVTKVISDDEFNEESVWAEPSRRFGNVFDAIIRDFFSEDGLSEYEDFMDENPDLFYDKKNKKKWPIFSGKAAFDDFVKSLTALKKEFAKNGETVISKGVTLVDKELMVAGTVDLITVDKEGNVRIYDVKTMRYNPHKGIINIDGKKYDKYTTQYTFNTKKASGKKSGEYELDDKVDSKRDSHFKQLSAYNALLNNNYGISAVEVKIIPIELKYESDDVVTSKYELHDMIEFTDKNGKPIIIKKSKIGSSDIKFDNAKTENFDENLAKNEKVTKAKEVKKILSEKAKEKQSDEVESKKGIRFGRSKEDEPDTKKPVKKEVPKKPVGGKRQPTPEPVVPTEPEPEVKVVKDPPAEGKRNGPSKFGKLAGVGSAKKSNVPTDTNEPLESKKGRTLGRSKEDVDVYGKPIKKKKDYTDEDKDSWNIFELQQGVPDGHPDYIIPFYTTSSKEQVSEQVRLNEIERIRQMLPDEIGIQLSDAFAQVLSNGEIAAGQFKNGIVYLTRFGRRGLGYHEAFHGIFRTMLTPSEKAIILIEARSIYGEPSLSDIDRLMELHNISHNRAVDVYYEEQMAEDFRDFALTKYGEYPTAIENFFRKLWHFINSLFTNDRRKDELFKNIVSGYYKNSVKPLTFIERAYQTSSLKSEMTFDEFAEMYEDKIRNSAISKLEESGEITKRCSTGISSAKFKAADGARKEAFTRGSQWEIVKDLKGYPSHKDGGVDLKFSDSGVSFARSGSDILAAEGLILPNTSKDGVIDYKKEFARINKENAHLNFVQRGLNKDSSTALGIDNKDNGDRMSHLMAWDGDENHGYVAYPTIIQDSENSLKRLDGHDAYFHAMKTGEFIKFNDRNMAEKYSQNGLIDHTDDKLPNYQPSGRDYKSFKNSLPDNLKNTNEDDYDMRYLWKHSGKPADIYDAQGWNRSLSVDENKKLDIDLLEKGEYDYNKGIFGLVKDQDADGNYSYNYHGNTIEPNTLRFLKASHHPTLSEELKWYNSDEQNAVEFRSKYDLDTRGKFYKYVPKKSNNEK